MKRILFRVLFIALLVVPILSILYSRFYAQFRFVSYSLRDKLFVFFLISVPVSAIYFLKKKEKYYKAYGVLICIYILYSIHIALKETSGAI
jgi:hypothetical protein